ncbi:hypothetical protein ANCCAN_08628 [Ancylostoma caninum]|uniref:Uncharacterized protein n=1 Tax=Ancylostoma caninum TaxID=29170 RepID=A0A368GQW7_ANCCA|nr:hypothetical protein ANCCAN_08628 [Ancylostoma caninum]
MLHAACFLILGLTPIRGDYDNPLIRKRTEITRSILLVNGTAMNTASKEDVRIYKKKGKPPTSTKVFECTYKGDDDYEDMKEISPLGCFSAVLTKELECESLVYGIGLLRKDKNSLKNHQESIAKCAAKRILDDYSKDPDVEGKETTERRE